MDAIDQFYPQDTVYNKALKNWNLALWDPDTLCGHPVMADKQSAQLYPTRLLYGLCDFLLCLYHLFFLRTQKPRKQRMYQVW